MNKRKEQLLYKKIKFLINMASLLQNKNFQDLQKKGHIGIYGSFAEGKDNKKNKIKIWIYTENDKQELKGIIKNLEKDMKRRINLLIINKDRIRYFQKRNSKFYIQLKLKSVQLKGDIFNWVERL